MMKKLLVRMSRENTALILVDLQDGYMENGYGGRLPCHERERIFPVIIRVIRYCAEHDLPVINVSYEGHGDTVASMRDALKDVPRLLNIDKNGPSVIECTHGADDIIPILKSFGTTHLFYAGIFMTGCVYASVFDTSKMPTPLHAHVAWDTMADTHVADRGRHWEQRLKNFPRYATVYHSAADFLYALR